jgi:hypothetical protein
VRPTVTPSENAAIRSHVSAVRPPPGSGSTTSTSSARPCRAASQAAPSTASTTALSGSTATPARAGATSRGREVKGRRRVWAGLSPAKAAPAHTRAILKNFCNACMLRNT